MSPEPARRLAAVDLERTSALGQVADALRLAILDGRLPPGTPLRETALADQLGVSRGTVREALRLLAPEGLVDHRAHRGAVVAELDPDDVEDLYRARAVVEVAAAERACGLGPERLAALTVAVEAMRAAARSDHVADYVNAHASFHGALVDMLGSERLSRFARSVQAELRLGFAVLDRMTGSLDDSVAAHESILDVLRGGDAPAARHAVSEHLLHGAEDVAELPPPRG